MWRHRATCSHCGLESNWNRNPDVSEQEVRAHLKEMHRVAKPQIPADYRLDRQRQCDFCLEPYVDDCTKCRQDFCRLHAGDIDGLCGGCI
jgi:hypothetical protein